MTDQSSTYEQDRLVLVGTRYSTMRTTWNEWAEPFEEVTAAIAERAKDQKANGHPSEIVEVIVVRRAVVRADITVEERPIAAESPNG